MVTHFKPAVQKPAVFSDQEAEEDFVEDKRIYKTC